MNSPVAKILIYTYGMLPTYLPTYLVLQFITTKLTILHLKTVLLSTNKASLSVTFRLNKSAADDEIHSYSANTVG